MSQHRLTYCNTNADPACWGWYQARCECGWSEIAYGHDAAREAHEAHVAAQAPATPPTGYTDSFGNVWAYVAGKRRMLAVGEVYFSTRGERRVVVAP